MRTALFFAATSSLALASCATPTADPAISQSEMQNAAQQHEQIVAQFGGAIDANRGAYVEAIGDRVAQFSGTPNAQAAYNFTTLNSAVENAFAIPGGRVYITRQLMGIMDDEAELAFVLGHEVGHIAADHSQARQATAQRNSILGVLGAVVGGVVGGDLGNVLAQGSQQATQLNTLSFSREQEYESDELGVRYMAQAGYNPLAAASMLSALGENAALSARVQGNDNRQTPEWARTHPLSENRTARAAELARQYPQSNDGMRNRDGFLQRIDGMIFDDDPAQGVIDGRSFTHPDLRLYFVVPQGYQMQNGATQVSIKGSNGQAIFTFAPEGDPAQGVAQVIQGIVGQQQRVQVPQPRRTTVNGLPAAYSTARVQSGNGAVDLSAFVYDFGGRNYAFAMITQAGAGIQPFAPMVESVRRLTDQQAAQVRPRVIDVVTVQRGDSVQSLARRMAYENYQVERFVALNGLTGGRTLNPGDKVKIVTYGR